MTIGSSSSGGRVILITAINYSKGSSGSSAVKLSMLQYKMVEDN